MLAWGIVTSLAPGRMRNSGRRRILISGSSAARSVQTSTRGNAEYARSKLYPQSQPCSTDSQRRVFATTLVNGPSIGDGLAWLVSRGNHDPTPRTLVSSRPAHVVEQSVEKTGH